MGGCRRLESSQVASGQRPPGRPVHKQAVVDERTGMFQRRFAVRAVRLVLPRPLFFAISERASA